MVKRLVKKIQPKKGFSNIFHIALNIFLPVLVFVLIRLNFFPQAVAVVLLSKWRIFAIRPRHWSANIRANAVDLIVIVSLALFMGQTLSASWQLIWAAVYAAWLIVFKPISSPFGVSLQALFAQTVGFMALFLVFGGANLFWLVLASWVIAYSAARHFFSSFEESLTKFLCYFWGYFAAALVWILGHWLTFYGIVAQPTLLLGLIGYGLAIIYYLYETEKLSQSVRRQVIFFLFAAVTIVLLFSDWGDKTI